MHIYGYLISGIWAISHLYGYLISGIWGISHLYDYLISGIWGISHLYDYLYIVGTAVPLAWATHLSAGSPPKIVDHL